MKVKYFLVLFLLLIFSAFALPDGVKVSAGTAKSSADAEEIKKRVIENCGLDPYWTAYMAVYGYVYSLTCPLQPSLASFIVFPVFRFFAYNL